MKIQINHIGKMEGHTDFVAEILKGDGGIRREG